MAGEHALTTFSLSLSHSEGYERRVSSLYFGRRLDIEVRPPESESEGFPIWLKKCRGGGRKSSWKGRGNKRGALDAVKYIKHIKYPVWTLQLLSQLCEAVISVYVIRMKYHFNHLIPTLGDFV